MASSEVGAGIPWGTLTARGSLTPPSVYWIGSWIVPLTMSNSNLSAPAKEPASIL